MSLYKLEKTRSCIIDRMPAVALLNSLGIREGIAVSVVAKQPLGGPIVVECGTRSIAIARDVAEQILVREVS